MGIHKFVFCQKSQKMFCLNKELLEEFLQDMLEYALIEIENKTIDDFYTSATDCIQYCKVNYEKVRCEAGSEI